MDRNKEEEREKERRTREYINKQRHRWIDNRKTDSAKYVAIIVRNAVGVFMYNLLSCDKSNRITLNVKIFAVARNR